MVPPVVCFTQTLTKDPSRSKPYVLPAPPKPLALSCTAADVDASIQAAEGPNALYTLAINYRNISGHECTLGPSRGPGTNPWTFPNGKSLQLCQDCLEPPLPQARPIFEPLILKKDETAHQAFSWITDPPDEGTPCLELYAMSMSLGQGPQNPYLLSRCPALLKKVCSPVQYGRYTSGPFSENLTTVRGMGPSLELFQDSKPHYPGQPIELQVRSSEPAVLLAWNSPTCPAMLRRVRNPNGETEWDQLGDKWCKPEHSAGQAPGGQTSLKIDAAQAVPGDHSLSLIQVLPPDENGSVAMAGSNTIQLNTVDTTTMPRHWGPTVKGIAVDVTLEKHTYELGEDIPLHIALENFSADASVVGMTPLWDFGSVVGIEVRDACQYRIKRSGGRFGMGHGLWMPYKQGVVVPMEDTVKNEGLLPAGPGTYTVTVSWSPHSCTGPDCGRNRGVSRQPYATVQDAESFEVIDSNHPEGISVHGAEAPCYPAGFEQVATSFGPYTALMDHATGMEWLHLDLTASRSYSDIKKNLAPGGEFEGWRYATPAELRQFFADFDGSRDGYSTDREIVSMLLKALGGPLTTPSNPSTGWHRESLEGLLDVPFGLGHGDYGYVAEDSTAGPVIDPKLQGSSRDDGAPYHVGSYLVHLDR
jgi:hypothetical protein